MIKIHYLFIISLLILILDFMKTCLEVYIYDIIQNHLFNVSDMLSTTILTCYASMLASKYFVFKYLNKYIYFGQSGSVSTTLRSAYETAY